MQTLQRNTWFIVLKWLIAAGSLFYVAYHITSRADSINLENINSVFVSNNLLIQTLFALIVLMLINWSIESIKWKLLIKQIETISFLKSLRAVLTGLTLSLYSPNRSGEFVGRVMHLQPNQRVKGSLLTFIGGICQLIITLQAGLIGLLFYQTSLNQTTTIAIVATILTLSFFLLYKSPLLLYKFRTLQFINKYAERFIVLRDFSIHKLIKIYLLSVLRYTVFACQFYLLLKLCNVNLETSLLCISIAISFMLTTIIPSIALGELGIRGSVNLYLFSPNHLYDTQVLIASFLLWLINLAIPALIGAICSIYIRWNPTSEQ